MKKILFLWLVCCFDVYAQQELEKKFVQAISDGACDTIKSLLIDGVNPNLQNEEGDTALLVAVNYNRIDLAELLITLKADRSLRNHHRWTPLQLAQFYAHAQPGRTKLVQILSDTDTK